MVETHIKRRGLMLVLSSPSGAGKTTISRRLLDSDDNLLLSISATTRPPRPGEAEGKDYFFVGHERFTAMIAGGRSEEHTSELQSLMRISYAVFCLKKKKTKQHTITKNINKQP